MDLLAVRAYVANAGQVSFSCVNFLTRDLNWSKNVDLLCSVRSGGDLNYGSPNFYTQSD